MPDDNDRTADAAEEQTNGDAPDSSGRMRRRHLMDVVGGPNLRLRDNAFQAIGIAAFTLAGLALGAWSGGVVRFWPLFEAPRWMISAVAGFALGVVVTGVVLMVYRRFRH